MIYKIGIAVFYVYFKLLFRAKVTGLANIPEGGPVILCSNHISNYDPLLLGSLIRKRKLHFMAKAELFRIPVLGYLVKALGAFPVDRDAPDISSYRAGLKVLKEGRVLSIFAQGRRFKEIDAKDAKSGVALFALKADANVIPIKIEPGYRLFRRMYIRIGSPVDLSAFRGQKTRSDTLKYAADVIVNRIAEL